MRHQPPLVVVLVLALLSPALGSAASPASSWFGFRPRDVAVTLTSQPPGAQVHLVAPDGTRRPLGSTLAPLVIDLPPGEHRFLFELAGHRPLTRDETLAGTTATIEAVMQPGTTTRFSVPIGWYSVDYERGPDGKVRIVPTTAPATRRPARDGFSRHSAFVTALPQGEPLQRATRTPTTIDTFAQRYRLLDDAVKAPEYPPLGCPVSQKDVYVLDTLYQVNPKKACLRLDTFLATLKSAMAKDR